MLKLTNYLEIFGVVDQVVGRRVITHWDRDLGLGIDVSLQLVQKLTSIIYGVLRFKQLAIVPLIQQFNKMFLGIS